MHSLQSVLNFRNLAAGEFNRDGKQLKNLYRSGDLSAITIDEIKILKSCNINEILDLRGVQEIELQGTTSFLPRTNIEISGQGEQNSLDQINQSDLGHFLLNLYHDDFVSSTGFSECIKYLLEKKGNCILFHCTAGKDRTGVLGALIMYMLDFNYNQIVKEYLKTDKRLIMAFEKEMMERDEKITLNFNSIKPLEAFIDGVEKKYNSIDLYIQKIGITDDDILRLKEYYLE